MTNSRTLSFLPLLAALLLLTTGPAAASRLGFDSGLPGLRTPMTVKGQVARGPYLEIELELDGVRLHSYVVPGAKCQLLFETGDTIEYHEDGPRGLFRRGEHTCRSVGSGNLRVWRDRKGSATRSRGRLVPRSHAHFELFYQDDEVSLLRGRFPEAARLGFAGSSDLIAVVPRSRVCQGTVARGVASMEYRSRGAKVLSLVGQKGLCTIRALITPTAS